MTSNSYPEPEYKWTNFGWGDDIGPWKYQILPQEQITEKLRLYAYAEDDKETGISSITFQPCLNEDSKSQDRRAIHSWNLRNGTWKFIGVFDGVYYFILSDYRRLINSQSPGHAGHETVDHTIEVLPLKVKAKLEELLDKSENYHLPPNVVSSALQDAIVEFDDSTLADFAGLFPGGIRGTLDLSDEEIDKIINDGGENLRKVHNCMRGTTALIALIDPQGDNVWIANLGDCEARK